MPTAANALGADGGFFFNTAASRSLPVFKLGGGTADIILKGDVDRGAGLGTGEFV